ncbi:DNA-binding protein [Pseudobacteriovorax antillogorgiicola]|uniref:Replication region DNA-binding N-term n=1 Tax=Pseudobacteriovorax antillogorgiicola TaxID=1513793 RepID=A0A1Y6CV41_9BACT|nr:DNA-binding protein [Pseudobacteriovorax antillogorgiicola]TCS51622.1 plasmid replication DNA-binding protein KfrA [Pseudobacteriovorax antillogorgiicola]SMF81491.1 replication region DNA-binding N-term [Pseudobacteriovorax antillogorgiicola]
MRTGISFEDVAAVAAQLRNKGINPTVRLVRAELGTGSFGTITAHLNAWRHGEDNKADASYVDTLSAGLKNAIANEIKVALAKAKEDLKARIEELESHLEQSADEISRLEDGLDWEKRKRGELEVELKTTQGQLSTQQEENQKLRDRIDTATDAASSAKIEAAESNARFETLKENHDRLLSENGELKAEVKELAKDVSRLEREKAVVEARVGK